MHQITRPPGRIALGLAIVRLAVAAVLVPFAIDWRSPLLASHRQLALAALTAVPLLLMAVEGWLLWSKPRRGIMRALGVAVLLTAASTLIVTGSIEANFQWVRARVLAADATQLEKLGRHFVVGYRDPTELARLIDRRAIAGVFVSARNVEGLSAEAIRQQIDAWRDVRRRQGLPPLLIATDQEGGMVSRLSPPLPRQPPIASVVAQNAAADARDAAAHDYGLAQGRALASVGVNLNFAPVVDLNKDLINPNDRYTRIRERAIATDPAIVTEVARRYCAGLREAGVQCTLKHFPGLGGVFEDTHFEAGDLRATVDELERSDWIPFRALMAQGTFTMLSHARLTALDAEHPVSFSQAVVGGLLRERWGHAGVLVTDDFSMGAVYGSQEGIGPASVVALNAGVDLLLIAYDPGQYFVMMDAVLAAARAGTLDAAALARSADRLANTAGRR